MPERQVAQFAVIAGKGDEPRQGGGQGGDGDARKQKRADHELAVPTGDEHEHACRHDAPEEGRHRQHVDAERLQHRGSDSVAERDCRHRRERGARRHTNERRIRQRIAEHALHHGTRHGQAGADEHGKQRARQANIDKHELLTCGARVYGMAKRGGDGARQGADADPRRTHGKRSEGGQRQQHAEAHQHRGCAEAAGVGLFN